MNSAINLCTSVMPRFRYEEAIHVATQAGFDGIELRVHEEFHQSLQNLERTGPAIRRRLSEMGLEIPVLNSYMGIDDDAGCDRLLLCAARMGVPNVRLVLPRSGAAGVSRLSREREIIPSYDARMNASDLLASVQETLRRLERKAARLGVKVLLELHWGTIMSSFTSAALLLRDLDPAAIGITFDPANMIVEGREDWEFGICLNRDRIANVHVKNASWTHSEVGPRWHWTPVYDGMVNWPEIISLLDGIGYAGDYAVEDFLTPRSNVNDASRHLEGIRTDLKCLDEHALLAPLT